SRFFVFTIAPFNSALLDSALRSEQQPQDQTDHGQQQNDHDPQHLRTGAGAAAYRPNDRPHIQDKDDQTQDSADLRTHHCSPYRYEARRADNMTLCSLPYRARGGHAILHPPVIYRWTRVLAWRAAQIAASLYNTRLARFLTLFGQK